MGVTGRATERPSTSLGIAQRLGRSFRTIGILVALALAIAVASGVVVLRLYQPELDHVVDARTGSRLAHQGMLDQETGVRGYLLADDTAFLQPYQTGRQELSDGDAQVSSNVGDNSTIAPLLLSTRLAEQAWTVGWAQRVLANPPRPGAAPTALLDEGKRLFDAYRKADDSLVSSIGAQYDQVRRYQTATLRAAALLQIVIFLVVLGLTVRESRRLRRSLVAPLATILGGMRRARDGDLEGRIAERGPAELRQVAVGLNEMTHALAEERSLRASRETEVLYQATKLREVLEMARNLAGSLNLKYVLDATAKHAVSVSGFESATVWLSDPADEVSSLRAAHAATATGELSTEERRPAELGQGCVGQAARFGRIVDGDGGGPGDPTGARSVMAVPMIVGARVVGVIELSSSREYTPPAGVLPIVETLASHAGTAVEAARLHERTEQLSQVDALTRLFNRRRLEADLDNECKRSRRYARPLSFCMLDVDHFKAFNDRHGHRRGDEVLEEVARLLRSGMRGSDSAYRYGGEEFALLLRDTPIQAAVALCERLRARVAQRFEGAEHITASFGVAPFTAEMHDPFALVEAADRALYQAKREGRDRVVAEGQPPDGGDVVRLRPGAG